MIKLFISYRRSDSLHAAQRVRMSLQERFGDDAVFIDREIPAALFAAVAQVLAYVYQLRAAIGGKAPIPAALPALAVPPELDPHHAKGADAPEDDA